MLDYDQEAARYDATRGGDARAGAAAAAIASLLPPGTTRIVDLACGTGIVTSRLGPSAVGIDRSSGMTRIAATRMPGRAAIADATSLPLRTGWAGAVTIIWLLHLLGPEDSAAVIAEAARILRPGGMLITTVRKNDAAYPDDDDAAALIGPVRALAVKPQTDSIDRVRDIAARHHLHPAELTSFRGEGQGQSPRQRIEYLRGGQIPWTQDAGTGRMRNLLAALAALPDQDRPRPDPRYQVLALRRD